MFDNLYREGQKVLGVPDTNAVDLAIAKAVSFMSAIAVSKTRGAGVNVQVALWVDMSELHHVAILALVRDGANRKYARLAVSAQMVKRTVHDLPHSMPSGRLSSHAATIGRPASSKWTEGEIGFVRRLARRWRDAVTQENPDTPVTSSNCNDNPAYAVQPPELQPKPGQQLHYAPTEMLHMPTPDWHATVFPPPKAMAVAKLVASHGMDAALERWADHDARTIYKLAKAGEKQIERRK